LNGCRARGFGLAIGFGGLATGKVFEGRENQIVFSDVAHAPQKVLQCDAV